MNYKRILNRFMNYYKKEEDNVLDASRFCWFEKEDEIGLVVSCVWIVFIPKEKFPLDLPKIKELYKPEIAKCFENVPTDCATDLGIFQRRPIFVESEDSKRFHKFYNGKEDVVVDEKIFNYFGKNSKVTFEGERKPVYIWKTTKKTDKIVGLILPIIMHDRLYSVNW